MINTKEKRIKRSRINMWLKVGIMLVIFLVGMIAGIALGIKAGQMILFEGLGVTLADSNINVTIDLNETIIIEGVREIAEDVLVPVLNSSFNKLK